MNKELTVEEELAELLKHHTEDAFTGDYDLPDGYELVAEEEDSSPRWFVDSTIVFRNTENNRHFGLTNRLAATEMQESEWANEILALTVTEAQQTVQKFTTADGKQYMSAIKKEEGK